ncbi:apolipoprotein N-acyltransferase [Pasteurella langaaensis DSM 22999]|uniref:Apolipoprotein N-acyltransferase n=1 Tax=Alitibacter langaaensis DSM 22999 TaxID=1122935 RepID=A0A2U0TGP7_9PAST|nr:apolipoprotein N-acyltransferase [Pasteurella langaaensis]PVX42799.1 apolipoprotein N-acyltransferase [Pasteurella langaaensis DSM 22999]
MSKFLPYFIALISGGIGVFAFSPYDYWGVAYVSLLGLIFVAKNSQKRTALWGSFLWGVSFFSIGTSWLHVSIHQFGGSPLWLSYGLVVLLAAYLALYPLLFAYIVQRFQVQSAVIFAAIWTLTEFLRGWVLTGFPWLQFGYSQIDSPFSGIAPIFGVTGLTFFTIWASAVLFNILTALCQHKNWLDKKWSIVFANIAMLAAVASLAGYSAKATYVKKNNDKKAITITLAQGDIAQSLKWDPEYLNSTLQIYGRQISENLGKSDLIILPESALPALENNLQPFFDALKAATQKSNTDVMIGTVYRDSNSEKLFNSIVVVDKNYQADQAQRYNKHHLVPFGEYVPLESLLRPLGSVFNLPMSAFQQGGAIQAPLVVKGNKFTPAICYEIILGDQLQQNLQPDTDFILTVSNDAWFGDSHGPWQHLQMARMRALELGKPVIRATNTGITAFINAQGKIIAQAPQFVETTLTQTIAPTGGKTPYAALGDKPLYLLALLFVILRALGTLIKRKLLAATQNKA